MAKETIDQFKVTVIYKSAKDKFLHLMRNFNKEMVINQTGSDVLNDDYTLEIGFKDDKAKWCDLFHSGEWVTSYTVKNVKSDNLSDEFDVEVKSKGGKKPFEKSFHTQAGWGNGKRFDHNVQLVSTKTKNLGVLNPYGKQVTKDEKDVLDIMRLYFIEAARNAGFTKASKIPEPHVKDQFTCSVIGGDYFYDYKVRLVCIHLAGWKIGFTPIEGRMDYFKVQMAHPGQKRWRAKKAPYQPEYTNDFTIPNRVRSKRDERWRTNYTWNELFLGDPKLGETLTKFFKCVANTPLPTV
jgi:hypothetical protein